MKNYLLIYFDNSRKKDHSYLAAFVLRMNYCLGGQNYTEDDVLSLWDKLCECRLIQILCNIDEGKQCDGFCKAEYVQNTLSSVCREVVNRYGLIKSDHEANELAHQIVRGLFRRDTDVYRLSVCQRRWLLSFLTEFLIVSRGLEPLLNMADVMQLLGA